MENKYKVSATSGISYHIDTEDKVIEVLDRLYKSRKRVRIYNGDVETGKAWAEENGTMGTIGRSSGQNKIPLLVPRKDSHGGPGMLEHCIVKIVETVSKRVLYQHPKFHMPTVEMVPGNAPGLPFGLKVDGEHYSNHKTEKNRDRLYNYFTK